MNVTNTLINESIAVILNILFIFIYTPLLAFH